MANARNWGNKWKGVWKKLDLIIEEIFADIYVTSYSPIKLLNSNWFPYICSLPCLISILSLKSAKAFNRRFPSLKSAPYFLQFLEH